MPQLVCGNSADHAHQSGPEGYLGDSSDEGPSWEDPGADELPEDEQAPRPCRDRHRRDELLGQATAKISEMAALQDL